MGTPLILCPHVAGVKVESGLGGAPWSGLNRYGPFRMHHGNANFPFETAVQACWDDDHLYVGFHCDDGDIVATMTGHDDPLYDEEVVEVFVAPRQWNSYFEFNVSPRNVTFDSLIFHTGERFHGNPTWHCVGLRTAVHRRAAPTDDVAWAPATGFGPWTAVLAIPFASLGELTPRHGDRWSINFYRIKRIPTEAYGCWSPTLLEPAQFHIPPRFGTLLFERED